MAESQMRTHSTSSSPAMDAEPEWNPLETLLLPMFRAKLAVTLLALLGLTGGVLFSLLKPNTYTSVAKVMLNSGQAESVVFDDPEARGTGGRIENAIHLLDNDEVFEMTARQTQPSRILAPYDPARFDTDKTQPILRYLHQFQSYWFRPESPIPQCDPKDPNASAYYMASKNVIRANTQITVGSRPSVFIILHTAQSAELAQETLTTLIEQHKKHHREIFNVSEIVRNYESLLSTTESELKELRTEFQSWLNTNQAFEIEARLAGLLQEREALQRQLPGLQIRLRNLKARLALARSQRSATSETLPPSSIPNPNHSARVQQIANYSEEFLTKLNNKYEKTHPDMVALSRKIQEANNSLNEIPAYLPQSETLENPRFLELLRQEQELDLEVSEAEDLVLAHKSQIKGADSDFDRLFELQGLNTDYRDRLRDLTTRVARHRSRINRLENFRNTKEGDLSNLRVFQRPTLPVQKSGPKRIKFVIAGLLAGLALGFSFAIFRNLLDSTVRRRKVLQQLLGVPVLATVPARGGWLRGRLRARKLG